MYYCLQFVQFSCPQIIYASFTQHCLTPFTKKREISKEKKPKNLKNQKELIAQLNLDFTIGFMAG